MANDFIEYRFINAAGEEFYEMLDTTQSVGAQVTRFSRLHKAVKAIPLSALPKEAPKPAKGLLVSIYKNPMYAGCSNGGVSERFNKAILIGPGIPEIFDLTEGHCLLRLERGNVAGTAKIVPVEQPKNSAGPMSGGAFVSTSDSRFTRAVEAICGSTFYGAVPLHDRFETWEEHERYSR